jgi:MFS transporter, DHA1 family, tetracycline resistance protein
MTASNARQPGVGFIFITLVLAVVGFGLLIPVLPTLIVKYEGADLSNGAVWYGVIMSSYSVMQFICAPILGSLSDRFGRRPIILVATAGSAIDYFIMAVAPSLSWFFVARLIAGATAGVLSTANAYIADVTPPEKRAQGFGMVGAAFGIGFVIGPAIGGYLGKYSLHLPFYVAGTCACLNWLYGYFVLPESLRTENRRSFSWKRANPVGALLAVRRFPAVFGQIEAYFIVMMAQAMLQNVWINYTGHRYHWDTFYSGLSLTFVGVASGFVQARFVKKIVPALGESRAVLLGLCISAMAQVCYGLASHGWMIYAFICFGAFAGIAQPALQSYVTKHVPANEQGAVQGVFASLQSLANIPGPLLASSIFAWAIKDDRPIWLSGSSFFCAAALVLLALFLAARSFRKDRARAAAEPAMAA